MSVVFIYALVDPKEKQEFHIYIGKSVNPYKRYYEHLRDTKPGHKQHWIQSLLKQGLIPDRQILEQCDDVEHIWKTKERYWIKFYRENNYIVVNETDGGESPPIGKTHGGWHHSEKTIQKMRENRSGKNHPMFGKQHSNTSKEKMKNSKLGNKIHLGYRNSELIKKAMGDAHRGQIPWNRGIMGDSYLSHFSNGIRNQFS